MKSLLFVMCLVVIVLAVSHVEPKQNEPLRFSTLAYVFSQFQFEPGKKINGYDNHIASHDCMVMQVFSHNDKIHKIAVVAIMETSKNLIDTIALIGNIGKALDLDIKGQIRSTISGDFHQTTRTYGNNISVLLSWDKNKLLIGAVYTYK